MYAWDRPVRMYVGIINLGMSTVLFTRVRRSRVFRWICSLRCCLLPSFRILSWRKYGAWQKTTMKKVKVKNSSNKYKQR